MATKRGPNIQTIIDQVDQFRDTTSALRERFEKDFSRYRLDKYDASRGPDGKKLEGEFRSYTSNEPRVFCNKLMAVIQAADMTVSIPYVDEARPERDDNDAKEKFIIGALGAADERLVRMVKPRLLEQCAFQTVVRGPVIGRALIRKRADGSSFIDITPLDPLHMAWAAGQDGMEWGCLRIEKTVGEIQREYGKAVKTGSGSVNPEMDKVVIYDYYDRKFNMVFTAEGKVIKPRMEHGSPRVPIYIATTGSVPLVSSTESSDTWKNWSESAMANNRHVWENMNLIMSIYLHLAAQARSRSYSYTSRDGTRGLEENPHEEASEVRLREGESIDLLQLHETTRDAAAFASMVSGEAQRGSVPHIAYGELQLNISGYAINNLRQGIESSLNPHLKAIEDAYWQISMLLSDQYATGKFKDIFVSGYRNRSYFEDTPKPDSIGNAGEPEIKFHAKLPQDDMQMYAQAQIARDPGPSGVPLLPDIMVRDKILGVQSADDLEDMIHEQMATRSLPEAQMWTLIESSMRRGRTDLAKMYMAELMLVVRQKSMMMMQMGGAAVPGQNGAGGGQNGLDPGVMPVAELGLPPSPATSQPGPQQAPGALRPGSGLVGPSGQPISTG
jgi:hypothetical protein